MKELYRDIAEQLNAGAPFALATVIQTRGSTPRKTSAKMLVTEDGQIKGTIGGGCGEAEAYQAMRKMAMDRNLRLVDVAENIIAVVGLMDS